MHEQNASPQTLVWIFSIHRWISSDYEIDWKILRAQNHFSHHGLFLRRISIQWCVCLGVPCTLILHQSLSFSTQITRRVCEIHSSCLVQYVPFFFFLSFFFCLTFHFSYCQAFRFITKDLTLVCHMRGQVPYHWSNSGLVIWEDFKISSENTEEKKFISNGSPSCLSISRLFVSPTNYWISGKALFLS